VTKLPVFTLRISLDGMEPPYPKNPSHMAIQRRSLSALNVCRAAVEVLVRAGSITIE